MSVVEHIEITDILELVAFNRNIISFDSIKGVSAKEEIARSAQHMMSCRQCNAFAAHIDESMQGWEAMVNLLKGVGPALPCYDPGALAFLMGSQQEEIRPFYRLVFLCHAFDCGGCRTLLKDALVSRHQVAAMGGVFGFEGADALRVAAFVVKPPDISSNPSSSKPVRWKNHPSEVDLVAFMTNRRTDIPTKITGTSKADEHRIERHLQRCEDCRVFVEDTGEMLAAMFEVVQLLDSRERDHPCPPPQLFDSFAADKLDSTDRESCCIALDIQSHLGKCAACKPLYRSALWATLLREIVTALTTSEDDLAYVRYQFQNDNEP